MRKQHLGRGRRATALLAVPILVLAIGGCGGDDNNTTTEATTPATTPTTTTDTTETTSGKPTVLKLSAEASGALKFDKSSLQASAGKVTIEMKNPSSLQHNVVIEGNGVDKAGQVVGQGGTSTAAADLKAGKYTYYCSVDGHEQAGMKGTLTVK